MNICIEMGNLTKDPELRTSASGLKVCHFSIAVRDEYNKEKTDFFDCTAFRQTAEFIDRYFAKGKPILVQGRLSQRKWEKDGVKRTAVEIIVDKASFCGGEKKGGAQAAPANENPFASDEGTPFEMGADEEFDALPM